MRTLVVALALLLPAFAAATEPPAPPAPVAPQALKVPAELPVELGEWATLSVETPAKTVMFYPLDPGLKRFPPELLVSQKAAVFSTAGVKEPGTRIRVLVYTAVNGEPTPPAICTIIVGAKPDKPTPPAPGPSPNPAPAPAGSLKVILAYESSAATTREQDAALNSPDVRAYLDARCGKDGWRKWDKDVDTSNESAAWQALWNAARPQMPAVPAVVVFVGQAGQWFPVTTEGELLALLKKFGG